MSCVISPLPKLVGFETELVMIGACRFCMSSISFLILLVEIVGGRVVVIVVSTAADDCAYILFCSSVLSTTLSLFSSNSSRHRC